MAQGDRLEPSPGNGGVGRGPGEAPMSLSREANDLGTNGIEGVSNLDMSRAIPGDVIGETILEQSPEAGADVGSRVGGAVKSIGSGGDRVWREQYLPDEQAVLEAYFK